MFAYYGSKRALASRYPVPKYRLIVEPFAGSAAYALHHWKDHDVWINDLDVDVYRLWCYLQRAPKEELQMLPRLATGQRISDHNFLTAEQRLFLSFHASVGSKAKASRDKVSGFASASLKRARLAAARSLHKIAGWRITNFDYSSLENVEATWFIDPPYKGAAGMEYDHSSDRIDYEELRDWCLSRRGQVIVCEMETAIWLPFRMLRRVAGAVKRPYAEVVFVREAVQRTRLET